MCSVVNTQCVHALGSDGAYSPETLDGQSGNEVQCLIGVDGAQSVGLAVVGGSLGQEFVV